VHRFEVQAAVDDAKQTMGGRKQTKRQTMGGRKQTKRKVKDGRARLVLSPSALFLFFSSTTNGGDDDTTSQSSQSTTIPGTIHNKDSLMLFPAPALARRGHLLITYIRHMGVPGAYSVVT